MATHADAQLWISRSLDGELDAATRHELAAHLESCPECRTVSRQLGALRGLLAEDVLATSSVGLGARVHARVRAERRAPPAPARPGLVPLLRRSAAAAACMLLLLGVVEVASLPGEALAEDPAPRSEVPVVGEELRAILAERPADPDGRPPRLLDLFLRGGRR